MGALYMFLELLCFAALTTKYVICQDPSVYNPSLGYLNCSTTLNHSQFVFNDGEEIQLLCSSETKGPQAFLHWSATAGDVELPDTNVYLSDNRSHIVATLTLTVDYSFDDVSFTCSRRSSLLLPIVDNCTLGPFYINSPTTTGTPTTSDPIVTKDERGTPDRRGFPDRTVQPRPDSGHGTIFCLNRGSIRSGVSRCGYFFFRSGAKF